MELEQLQILKMLEAGRISAEEAATLLAALETGVTEDSARYAAGQSRSIEGQENPWARLLDLPVDGWGDGAPSGGAGDRLGQCDRDGTRLARLWLAAVACGPVGCAFGLVGPQCHLVACESQ